MCKGKIFHDWDYKNPAYIHLDAAVGRTCRRCGLQEEITETGYIIDKTYVEPYGDE